MDTNAAQRIWDKWLADAGWKSDRLDPSSLVRLVEDEIEVLNKERESEYART